MTTGSKTTKVTRKHTSRRAKPKPRVLQPSFVTLTVKIPTYESPDDATVDRKARVAATYLNHGFGSGVVIEHETRGRLVFDPAADQQWSQTTPAKWKEGKKSPA